MIGAAVATGRMGTGDTAAAVLIEGVFTAAGRRLCLFVVVAPKAIAAMRWNTKTRQIERATEARINLFMLREQFTSAVRPC